ncbi:hypothetical protein ACFY3U_27370 [Micromonospora sp. NPDC000089]|uniref:hypothetical protein n=1 Tax=unclassified Micromonospora TaxID=2617518 RepID=UPI0036ADCC4B
MSEDPPVPRQDDRSDGTAVLEWGAAERPAPGRHGRRLGALARDRRLPLVLTAVGAVAVAASLVGEWLVMTVPNGDPDGTGTARLPGGVGDVGSFGVAYLVGLLLLAGAVALALRGSPAVRHDARWVGLAVAAALLALLAATAFSLDDPSQRALLYAPQEDVRVDYGRGLVTAVLGMLLIGAALLLAGRAPAPGRPDDGDDPEDRPADPRRDELPPAPADLTVTPTVPFARRDPGA